jgi:hypothetical protein
LRKWVEAQGAVLGADGVPDFSEHALSLSGLPGSIGAHEDSPLYGKNAYKGIFSLNLKQRKSLHAECSKMAKLFIEQDDRRLVHTAANSTFKNKVAAALFWGLVEEHDDCLYHAMQDKNAFVVQAAYESCVLIAKKKYDNKYPFESGHDKNDEERETLAHMTEVYFGNLSKKKPANGVEKKKRTVQDILGLKEDE